MRWRLAARFNASDGQGAARDGCSSRRASDDEKEQGTAAAARRAVGARKRSPLPLVARMLSRAVGRGGVVGDITGICLTSSSRSRTTTSSSRRRCTSSFRRRSTAPRSTTSERRGQLLLWLRRPVLMRHVICRSTTSERSRADGDHWPAEPPSLPLAPARSLGAGTTAAARGCGREAAAARGRRRFPGTLPPRPARARRPRPSTSALPGWFVFCAACSGVPGWLSRNGAITQPRREIIGREK